MAIMPIVRLFFPCAHIEKNPSSGSVTIVDPIDSIFLPNGVEEDFVLGPIYFYVQVKEGLGNFYFRIEVKDHRGRRLAKTKPRELTFSKQQRNLAQELVFMFRQMRLDSPGVLQIELFANELVLATWELSILASGGTL